MVMDFYEPSQRYNVTIGCMVYRLEKSQGIDKHKKKDITEKASPKFSDCFKKMLSIFYPSFDFTYK